MKLASVVEWVSHLKGLPWWKPLVVIGIIALLISILPSSLNQCPQKRPTRSSARTTSSKSGWRIQLY